jgi:pSer/pThr/pTyr-binding forkhead associated (FHA) protein
MAWIIVSANGEEIDRRELTTPVVVGRSSESDLAIRDILLSRAHCRLEPVGHDWRVVDLNSKNGTRVGWQEVSSQTLKNGDHLRMGRTRIIFYTTPFEPAPPDRKPRTDRMVRPADPHEALSGTVTDFVLLEEEHLPHDRIDHHPQAELPAPKPRPRDPAGYSEPQGESRSEDHASSFL